MIEALREALAAAGVEVRPGVEVTRARVAGGRVVGVESTAGEIPAGAFVNAAGAGTRALARQNGVDVAAVPLLESRVLTEPLPGVTDRLPMLLFFERDLFYARSEDGGLLLGAIERELGPGSRVPLDAPPRAVDLPDHAAAEPRAARARANYGDPGAHADADPRARERPADVDPRRAPHPRGGAGYRGVLRALRLQ